VRPSLAALSGLVLALALPGAGIWPLALVFPGLLLEAIHGSRRVRAAAGLGWLAGTVHWAVAVHWVVPVMHRYGGLPMPAAVACRLGMSAILGLTWAAAAAVARLAPYRLAPAALAFAWAAAEAARQGPLFRFPWNPVAAAFVPHPALLASLPVWGATGLGWAVVAVSGGLWGLARRETRAGGRWTALAAVGLAVAAAALAPPARPGREVRVGVIQPGTTLEERWEPALAGELEARAERLTRAAAAAGARLVLWPESAAPYSIERDPVYRRRLVSLARELGVTLVVNAVGWTADGRPTNSAYVVTAGGVGPRRYDKVRLVPFGEFVPWWARLAFTETLVREVGDFAPGHRLAPLDTPEARLGVAICYEIVFPDLVAEEVRRGAEVLVTLTNDGWYGYSWAPAQHFAQAALRAVETRRWVARAALTGISGFVAPDGRVAARLEVGDRGMLAAPLAACSGLTPRARRGDWWGWLSGLAALLLAAAGAHGRRAAAARKGEPRAS